jgi:rhodanese-related sulfurtransferase
MSEPAYPLHLTVQELAEWRDAPRPLTLLDVREDWERELVRFPDGLAIPLNQLPQRVGELPQDVPLVVLCHHGGRSQQAVAWLRHIGVANAINLQGGIDAWAREIDQTMGVY